MGKPVALEARALARHARIHLDGHHPSIGRVDRELNVAAAGLDADFADDRQTHVAQPLILLVRQRLRRRHRDRVAGVDAHRIEVLDGADDDDVVGHVAHDLQLELLPADDRLLNEHLAGRRQVETAGNQLVELLAVVSDAAAATAQGEAGPQHARQPHLIANGLGLGERTSDAAGGHGDADLEHGGLELFAVLGLGNGQGAGADHLDIVLVENAMLVQVHGGVEGGLTAEGRQQRVGPFLLNNAGDDFPGDRLDVGTVGHARIGHDGGRVGVDENDGIAFLTEGLARLRPGVVELTRLTDYDGAGADQENLAQVGSLWHVCQRLPGSLRWGQPRTEDRGLSYGPSVTVPDRAGLSTSGKAVTFLRRFGFLDGVGLPGGGNVSQPLYDPSGKWMIEEQGAGILYLAGARSVLSCRARKAEVVQPASCRMACWK